jgi:hypothetical protein
VKATRITVQSLGPPRKKRYLQNTLRKATVLARSNWKRAWIVSLWLLICVGLFLWKFFQYRQRSGFEVMGYCLCTAKGAAETLKFNMALILLPVCRNTITWLRSTWFSSVVPFNDNINFHKLIVAGIVVGIILHGGTHLACDFSRIVKADHYTFQQKTVEELPQMGWSCSFATGNSRFVLNSGMMMIEPSNCTFRFLLRHRRDIVSYNGGDQGYLNEFFPAHTNVLL